MLNLSNIQVEKKESPGHLSPIKSSAYYPSGGALLKLPGSLRLGAEKVDVISLERYLQMPASDEEKLKAQKEGIEFHNGFGTKKIHERENTAQVITLKKCRELFDLNNNFNPVFDEDDTLHLQCDHIIGAS